MTWKPRRHHRYCTALWGRNEPNPWRMNKRAVGRQTDGGKRECPLLLIRIRVGYSKTYLQVNNESSWITYATRTHLGELSWNTNVARWLRPAWIISRWLDTLESQLEFEWHHLSLPTVRWWTTTTSGTATDVPNPTNVSGRIPTRISRTKTISYPFPSHTPAKVALLYDLTLPPITGEADLTVSTLVVSALSLKFCLRFKGEKKKLSHLGPVPLDSPGYRWLLWT